MAEREEAVAFLRWIDDGNFIFVGMRGYDHSEDDAGGDSREHVGFGILRDPEVKVLRRGRER